MIIVVDGCFQFLSFALVKARICRAERRKARVTGNGYRKRQRMEARVMRPAAQARGDICSMVAKWGEVRRGKWLEQGARLRVRRAREMVAEFLVRC
jgi:hypothetical protein